MTSSLISARGIINVQTFFEDKTILLFKKVVWSRVIFCLGGHPKLLFIDSC